MLLLKKTGNFSGGGSYINLRDNRLNRFESRVFQGILEASVQINIAGSMYAIPSNNNQINT